ncbi:hypothetical protein [Candidatus Odyssella acanthamoebae]|uniref:Uncharacterized protein n=1 Tax=Candidatus Odyssella acanthamoebae TaxID=91604 RepID=A0A077AXU5_9PROT|nr:hypothetical protein [Candidatus Paracaedibacter acanthamoebae]AIK96834.1 hypothetical protein ID47_08970 [Candidatus Paracaedibacter acanthamoebae]
MKKSLKVLISSLMIALTFASSQGIHGMEDSSERGEQGVKRPFVYRVPSVSDITEDPEQKKRRGEEIRENPFNGCPKEITAMVLQLAAIDECLNNRSPVNILLVCREWQKQIEEGFIAGKTVKKLCQEAWYGVPGHEEIYERFLKSVLIYRPQKGSEVGMITMRISELGNPLEGTFDLSQCGNVGKYLSISTGYRKGKKQENKKKLEIWLAPRFLIEKKLTTTAGHFQCIFGNWSDKAPVGIFWTWGGSDDLTWYDYLTRQNYDELSTDNLYEKCHEAAGPEPVDYMGGVAESKKFHVHFLN